MRKSMLAIAVLLCIGCQNNPTPEKAPGETAEQPKAAAESPKTAEPVEATAPTAAEPTKTAESAEAAAPTAAEPPKAAEPEDTAAPLQEPAPAEAVVDEKCKDIACGVHQTCEEGLCVCGEIKLMPQDAATWECVDDHFRCYRKAGCSKEGETSPKSTVLGERLNNYHRTFDSSTLIPLDPNGKYPAVTPIKPLPYSKKYRAKSAEDAIDYIDVAQKFKYCDGVKCNGICQNNICFEALGKDFVRATTESGQGGANNDPKEETWVCPKLEGCWTKYGEYYRFGQSFELTGESTDNSILSKIEDRFPSIDTDDYRYTDMSGLGYLHLEIPNQYDGDVVCLLDKCCCGEGECAKGEKCMEGGECLKPDTEETYLPKHKACGKIPKQKPPKKGEYRPDYDKMCFDDIGCKCDQTVCPKTAECHDGKCFCTGVESPGAGYECKQGVWKCTDPEICPPEELYKQQYCGDKARIGDGYICRKIVDPDTRRTYRTNPRLGDDSWHYDIYRWQCAVSEGCNCGNTQCSKGESCIDGECYCGFKRTLAATGWTCESGQMVCAQETGCDCFDTRKKKGESCSSGDGVAYRNKDHLCGDVICSGGTQCLNGKCTEPGEYVPNWGFLQCNWDEGCTCGDMKCKKDEFCRQNRCIRTPTYIEAEGHMVEYVPVAIEEFDSDFIRFHDTVFIPQQNTYSSDLWSFGYDHKSAAPEPYQDPLYEGGWDHELINDSSEEFIKAYGFEQYYRTPHASSATCRGVPFPKDSSGFVCIVGVSAEVEGEGMLDYVRYYPNEIGWMCSLKEGCPCGGSKCSYQQSCIDQKCDDFSWIKHVRYIDEDDPEYEKYKDYNELANNKKITLRRIDHEVCQKDEGCPCGETYCYKGGSCYYNEYCYYDYRGPHEGGCPDDGNSTDVYIAGINKNGTCHNYKYMYPPYLYRNDPDLSLECIQKKCSCGEIQCTKGEYCVEPGRCIGNE